MRVGKLRCRQSENNSSLPPLPPLPPSLPPLPSLLSLHPSSHFPTSEQRKHCNFTSTNNLMCPPPLASTCMLTHIHTHLHHTHTPATHTHTCTHTHTHTQAHRHTKTHTYQMHTRPKTIPLSTQYSISYMCVPPSFLPPFLSSPPFPLPPLLSPFSSPCAHSFSSSSSFLPPPPVLSLLSE